MPYQPSNRTGVAPLGALAFVAGGTYWYVDDIDCRNNPIAYGSSDSEYRVMPDRGGFILCSKVGSYVKWPPRRGASKSRTRRFKTATAAGEHAILRLGGEA